MYCLKCGKEIKEGSQFCGGCGAPLVIQNTAPEMTAGKPERSGKTGRTKLIVGIAAAAVVLAGGAAALLLGRNSGSKTVSDTASEAEEREPLYVIEDIESIDLTVQNHQSGTKQQGLAWNTELFYWLEDVDTTSDEDGNIALCRISKTQIKNSVNGNLIEYEIYRDADTGEIYKIVGVEHRDENLLLTDYYYMDGKPNFIFRRTDSIYTPTYATTSKIGERFYFDNDVMVRWRTINVPEEIEEVTLSVREVSYVQNDYFAQNAEEQAEYDEMELAMLNEAYNVYDTVSGSTGIGVLQGTVKDTKGIPMAGRTVEVIRAEDGELLYRGTVGEDGCFSIYVYLDDTRCRLQIGGTEEYRDVSISDIRLADGSLIYAYDNLIMHRVDGDEYPVQMAFSSVEEESTLPVGIKLFFREGTAAYEGDAVLEAEADENGQVSVDLPEGTYTVEVSCEGWQTAYYEVEAREGDTMHQCYLAPEIPEGQSMILLTWEGEEIDLDLTIFTPYQTSGGDMAHIGGNILSDEYGNRILSDNESGYEAAYIDASALGSYKIYVNDYTDIQAGNYDTDALSGLHVHIYIYGNSGLLASYEIPIGERGVVWEVAQVSGSQVTADQRVYTKVEGKSWWLADKREKRLVKESYYLGDSNLSTWYEYSYDSKGNRTKEIRCRDNGEIYQQYEWEYDDEGYLIKNIGYSNGDGSIWYWDEYSYYNERTEMKRLRYYSDGSTDDWQEVCYDRDGNETKHVYYRNDGSIRSWVENSYDSQGNITKFVEYLGDSFVGRSVEYHYDGEGNMTESITYNSDGSAAWWDEYNYDNEGNKTKVIRYYSDGMRQWDEYSYDSQGNMTKCISYDVDDSITGWNEWEYDSGGNQTKEIQRLADGSVGVLYEWEYDNQGYQTKKIHYNSDGSISDWIEYTYESVPAVSFHSKDAALKDITWEDYDSIGMNPIKLHFIFEDETVVDLETELPGIVEDISYEDITGDGVDEALVYTYFANTMTEYQIIYFYRIGYGKVAEISPAADIPKMSNNAWDMERTDLKTDGYSSPVFKMQSYYKEDTVAYPDETLYIGYKDGRWELVQE